MSLKDIHDRRLRSALGFLSRADVGYIRMRKSIPSILRQRIVILYPWKSDAEAFVLLALQFADKHNPEFLTYINLCWNKHNAEEELIDKNML